MVQNTNQTSNWVGWVFFGGVMMIIGGLFQAIAGLTGLIRHSFYVVSTNSSLLVFNYKAWGWIDLGIGLLILLAGFSLLHGSTWARFVGVVVASLSIFASLATANEFPLWAIALIVIDALVIYAITVHGSELKA
ncbi:MAG TPA: hypothetical protein VMR28_00870 [Candidatus Saccharimonadales bacterium]|nr:hypothetical protein [Candidatus Saccharimonadales bacterium]